MRTAIQQLSYILILLTIFSSCNKDNEKEIIEESYEMNIKVEYTKWSESYPDEGSKIYIYFNRQMEDFTAMKYEADGVYYSVDKIIRPDQTDIADKNGLAIIDFRDHLNIKFSLMVESRYTGLRAFMYFEKYVFAKEHTFSFFKSTFE